MGGVRQAPPVRLWRGALLRVGFGRFVFDGFARVLDLDHFAAGPDESVFAAADGASIDMNRHLRRLAVTGEEFHHAGADCLGLGVLHQIERNFEGSGLVKRPAAFAFQYKLVLHFLLVFLHLGPL